MFKNVAYEFPRGYGVWAQCVLRKKEKRHHFFFIIGLLGRIFYLGERNESPGRVISIMDMPNRIPA